LVVRPTGHVVPALHDDPPKRSSDGVNHPVPRSHRAEPKTPWGVPATKVVRGAGNTRGAGARSSFGWQTSVGRIARLLHREVARPVGESERALAGKKCVSPLTWSADGQKVKRCACIGSLTSLPVHGLRVSACRFSIRWKAFSGLCPPCFHRRGEAGSSDSQVQFRITIREERDDGPAHRADIGFRLGCACG
jgi:hypothetical protein